MCAPHGGCSTGILKETSVRYSNTSQTAPEQATIRTIVVDSLVGMIAGATGMVPPREGPLPDFIQGPVDRAVERIAEALEAVTVERDQLRAEIEGLRKRPALPSDWEDRIFDEMTQLFENRHVGMPGIEAMVIDDTQVGVEFACKRIAALAAKEGV